MSTVDRVALAPDAASKLQEIGDLIVAMTPAERHAASVVYASVMQAFALHGHDDNIAGAQVLSRCVDLVLIADREERRASQRQAL